MNQESRQLAYEVMQCATLRLIDSHTSERLLVEINKSSACFEASRNALAGIRELQEGRDSDDAGNKGNGKDDCFEIPPSRPVGKFV